MGLFKSKEEKEQIANARAFYAGIGTQTRAAPPEALALATALQSDPTLQVLSDKERRKLSDQAFERWAEAALADDILDEEEEEAVLSLGEALGVDQEALTTHHRPLLMRLFVARVNDGRLPTIDAPTLMTKKGEVVHMEMAATLLKEVAHREYRGGYSGVSFRVAKGVRFSTGGIRGHSVVVGTDLQPADEGILSITSHRAVFSGHAKTIEFAYAKLVNLDVLSDGIRFHVSNRQTAHLFQVESGEAVAAAVNAAFQAFDA